MKRASQVHSHIAGRDVRPLVMTADDVRNYAALSGIGINLSDRLIGEMMDGIGMDAGDDVGITPAPLAGLTTASITTPVQFLQNWLPGFVRILTAARKIDELIGIMTVGAWEDEEIVQGVLEPTGTAQPYGDYTNVPLSSWNTNFVVRNVVRFEQGMLVGMLEEARAARIRISTAAEKRSAAAVALDIQRNRVGFYGYNDGSGACYGFLNDPNLPGYNTVATGVGGLLWSEKTFNEIVKDFVTALAGLQNQSLDLINPQDTPITFAVATVVYQYLNIPNALGTQTVRQWVLENYPKLRIVSAPELNGANGGANVGFFYADKIEDGGSDGGATWAQVVPAKFQALGVEKRSKSYIEDYANATAGSMLKRPFAVYQISGI
jgi:hypothetical protein